MNDAKQDTGTGAERPASARGLSGWLQDLPRGDIFKVIIASLLLSSPLMQLAGFLERQLNLPNWTGTIIIVILIGCFLTAIILIVKLRSKNNQLKNTILWGTLPHEMEGRVSNQLRRLMLLPRADVSRVPLRAQNIEEIATKSAAQKVVSTLLILEIPQEKSSNSLIQLSMRADFVGDEDMHVSQAAWAPSQDGGGYELDEWVFKDNSL